MLFAAVTQPVPALPPYSRRHQDPAQARAYRVKFEKSVLRRLSHRRELACVTAALHAARATLPGAGIDVVLDLPCGAGRFAPLLAQHARVYLAADFSPAMAGLCRDALAAAGLRDRLRGPVVADARFMPIADGAVDLACCLRLLHHLPHAAQRLAVLRGLRRVARGPAIVTFLDADSLKQRLHRLKAHVLGRRSRRTLLARTQLAAEAAAAGFSLARVWRISGWFSGQSIALLVPLPT